MQLQIKGQVARCLVVGLRSQVLLLVACSSLQRANLQAEVEVKLQSRCLGDKVGSL